MSHHPLRILFISDTPGSLERTNELLKQTDIGLFELENATVDLSVLVGFTHNDYDVCIIDCLRDGVNVIAESHRLGFSVPIIMLTADSASEVLDAIHRGASDCLVRELLTPALLEQSICAVIQRADSLKAKAQYERCYLGLMENASDVIYTHDFQGNYTSINKAGEHLTGYTAEETLQMNFRQIVAPEYIPSVQRAVNRMLADRKRSFFEAMVITKDNRRVSVKVSMHLIYREGRPIGVQGIARQAWSIPSAFAAGEEHARSA